MKGYRTLIVNMIALMAALFGMYGIDIPVEDQTAISTAVLAILNIALRFITTTPIGEEK